jgi:hypothetical protein
MWVWIIYCLELAGWLAYKNKLRNTEMDSDIEQHGHSLSSLDYSRLHLLLLWSFLFNVNTVLYIPSIQ